MSDIPIYSVTNGAAAELDVGKGDGLLLWLGFGQLTLIK
jgi:hypothetical protein